MSVITINNFTLCLFLCDKNNRQDISLILVQINHLFKNILVSNDLTLFYFYWCNFFTSKNFTFDQAEQRNFRLDRNTHTIFRVGSGKLLYKIIV